MYQTLPPINSRFREIHRWTLFCLLGLALGGLGLAPTIARAEIGLGESAVFTIANERCAESGVFTISNGHCEASAVFTIDNPGGVGPDLDRDGDVDADDLVIFVASISGPGIACSAESSQADFDHDGDVDQVDFGIFQRYITRIDRQPVQQAQQLVEPAENRHLEY